MQFLINPERRNAMKRLIVLSAVLALSIVTIPLGRAQGMGGMDMKGMGADVKSEAQSHKGVGTVKKVDSAGGKVTIAHGPIPTMKWPAMNMTFTVKDQAMIGKLSQDKKVEFEFVERGSDYLITSVK